eukprot:5380735-Prymnesium_polylepis.1
MSRTYVIRAVHATSPKRCTAVSEVSAIMPTVVGVETGIVVWGACRAWRVAACTAMHASHTHCHCASAARAAARGGLLTIWAEFSYVAKSARSRDISL